MEITLPIIIITISEIVSFFLIFRLVKSITSNWYKLFFTVLLIVPVLGPFFYLWITSWPNISPEHLNGAGAGLGRKFIDEQSSRASGTLTVNQQLSRDVQDAKNRKVRKKERKKNKRWK